MLFLLLFLVNPISCLKSKLTLDEFLNYTDYSFFSVSPNDGKLVVIQRRDHIWELNENSYSLQLLFIENNQTKLITNHSSSSIEPIWFNQWIVYLYENNSNEHFYFHFYSIENDETFAISIGKEIPHSVCWTNDNTSLYFSTRTPWTNETELDYQTEWNDVIQYREQERGDTIFHLNIEDFSNYQIKKLINISFIVKQIIYSSDGNQIIFSTSSMSERVEKMEDFEIYSLDLNNLNLLKLTNNNAREKNLKWFNNNSIFFTVDGEGSIENDYKDYQGRIYLLNLTNGEAQRWAKEFPGHIADFDLLDNGNEGIIILGQLKTTIEIYTQLNFNSPLIRQTYSNGSYESIQTFSKNNKSTIAFIYSSFDKPQEIYIVNDLKQLNQTQQITFHNQLFTERNLPQGKSYQWINKDDQTEIEGILLYPPDQYLQRNLSLLVLIHGGPYSADLNIFHADWYYCAIMFATHGWLVLQPNYRGSTGYGDEFLNGIRHEIVSLPGKDILYGVQSLIKDGIVNPMKLSIGGYSYGGYLTNWLITQTNIFNAALSGAGAVEHISDWGTNDLPLTNHYFIGYYPWEKSSPYEREGAIYYMNKVCTPTHIVTGELDIRVPTSQSYILERSLNILNIPTKFLIFPAVGHDIENNPWHEKIKLREELKWLEKYGNIPPNKCLRSAINSSNHLIFNSLFLYIYFIFFSNLKVNIT